MNPSLERFRKMSKFDLVVWILNLEGESREARDVLRAIVTDIEDYERMNNLYPNPNKSSCWDSVARAKKLLTDHERREPTL